MVHLLQFFPEAKTRWKFKIFMGSIQFRHSLFMPEEKFWNCVLWAHHHFPNCSIYFKEVTENLCKQRF